MRALRGFLECDLRQLRDHARGGAGGKEQRQAAGLLEEHTAREMLAWDHAGGFSLDARVRIAAHDRAGLERLLRYCARPPFALNRIEWQGSGEGEEGVVFYRPPRPTPDGRRVLRLSPLEFLWTGWPPWFPHPASIGTAITGCWPRTRPSDPW